jgi:hypothetical protein
MLLKEGDHLIVEVTPRIAPREVMILIREEELVEMLVGLNERP